ncbi:PilN domain-containing protein [Bradyrhizobium manausense]|uniref:PilN domain-containing protein n=1 Tax=Bradyrhizobium manausense TaxID=989370 RepID=UPI001BA8A569|nr:PilN domain-containing protein [Bradyrhizobium manausense]MBR0836960.1 PilN domain-containing protein [Bradyrhizobium manausense]
MTDVSVTRLQAPRALAEGWQKFTRWWMNELRECSPKTWHRVLQAGVETRLFIWADRDAVVCHLVAASGDRERRFLAGHLNRALVDDWLAECGCERDAVRVGVALESDLFFQRGFRLPRSELDALNRILAQEVVHRTPFQLADIWHGVTPDAPSNDGVAGFRHWIIPKDRAATEIARLGLQVPEIDFIAVTPATGAPIAVVTLGESRQDDPPWVLRTTRILAVALLIATMAGLLGFEWWQSSRAAGLEDELFEAKQGVQLGRQEAGSPARLVALKAVPGSLAAWDELSRVIPDHTFLTEVRIAAGTITLSGVSSDAARLVRTLDGSRLFTGATLVGPITPDATERRDRFHMSLKLRKGGAGRVSKPAERPES